MLKHFHKIIEDHRKRNIKTVLVLSIFFILLFSLAILMSALFTIKIKPAQDWTALYKFKLGAKQYVFAFMEFFFIGWWVVSHLKFRMLRDRASLISNLIRKDYEEAGMDLPATFIIWNGYERNSVLSRKIGSKLMFSLAFLLLVSGMFSLGQKSITAILLSGLIVYEIFALLGGNVVRAYFVKINQNYAIEAKKDPPSEKPTELYKLLVEALFVASLFCFVLYYLFNIHILEKILFSLAFLGLYLSTVITKDTDRYLMKVSKFADTVRMQRTGVVIS
jgi:hypothetical protein